MSKPQSFSHHTRTDPAFHYFAAPILLIHVIYQGVRLAHHLSFSRFWSVLVALALLIAIFRSRIYSLRLQDRIIRMEERVRIAAVVSPGTLARMDELTIPQLVALRFASLAELGSLSERALSEKLTSKQIKQSIVDWRADMHRI